MKHINTFEKFDPFSFFRKKTNQAPNQAPVDNTNIDIILDSELYNKIPRNEYNELINNQIGIPPIDIDKIYDSLSGWEINLVDSKIEANKLDKKLFINAIEDEWYLCTIVNYRAMMKSNTESIFKCDGVDGLISLIDNINNLLAQKNA